MKRYVSLFFTFITIFIATGCSNNRPSNIADVDEMADVLYEVHEMESMIRCNRISNLREKPYIYNNILKSHNLTPEQFDSCVMWYSMHKDDYLKVYSIIQNKIQEEKNGIMNGKYTVIQHKPVELPRILKEVEPKEDVFSSLHTQLPLLPLR